MPEEITSSVGSIEAEAEKILEEARNRAREIILEAKEEAKKILSSDLPLNEAKDECVKIVNDAKAEADRTIEDADKKAADIRNNADKKAKDIVELVVNTVAGRS